MLNLVLAFCVITQAVDIDKILERADKIFDEAKSSYEAAREKGSAPGFVDAGFKLEEARIKYIVLQEIGSPEKQKEATDRLRAVNQLAKLIHDGKVAVSGAAVGADVPAAKPAAAAPSVAPPADDVPRPPALALQPPPNLRIRLAVPEAAKLKDAERIIKDLFKEQYAKKAPADRQLLARLLVEQAGKAGDDAAALWILYRDAQDLAAQVCDLKTVMAAIDGTANYFDVDALAMRNTALTAAGKAAKTPEDSAELTRALLLLIEDLVAADQYDVADKAAAAALLQARRSNDVAIIVRVTNRSREITEAKTRFQAMKNVLQTLAKTPEDPGANSEMGQFLCYVKGNWDLGLRFLAKGSDATLKTLAEKELAMSLVPLDQAAIGDGWWDLGEKEKSPLRKGQMQTHARQIYEGALPGLTALARIKIEKRMEASEAGASGGPVTPGAINLMKLIDINKDVVAGVWKLQGDKLVSDPSQAARVEIPYEPPAEYDFKIVFMRNSGGADIFQALTKNKNSFEWSMGAGGSHVGFGLFKSYWVADPASPAAVDIPGAIVNGKTYTSLVQVRKDGLKGFLDGKLIKELPQPYGDLTAHGQLRLRNDSILGVGSYDSSVTFLKIELVEVTGKGKKTR
jgi:hypothetical protein